MDFDFRAAIRAAAHEHDAGAGFSRMKREGNRKAGVNPNADDRRAVAKGGLPARFHTQGPQPH